MAAEDARMLRAALFMRRFTKGELQEQASVNPNTASSWLTRNRQWLQETPGDEPDTGRGRGRPNKTWQLLPEGVTELSRALASASGVPERTSINEEVQWSRLEELLRRTDRARLVNDESEVTAAMAAARLRVRTGWERFAEMSEVGYEVPDEQLSKLASYERKIGVGDSLTTLDLTTIARSASLSIDRMHEQHGVSRTFAARVVAARATARGQGALLTAAALAASIRSYLLRLSGRTAEALGIQSCAEVLRGIPIDAQLSHASYVLDLTSYSSPSAEDRQAIALGIAHRHSGDHYLQQAVAWLLTLRTTRMWSDELAPAIAYGALEARSVELRAIIEALGESLDQAVDNPLASSLVSGSIQARAMDCCRFLLRQRTSILPAAAMPDSQRKFGVADYFCYRPTG